MEYSDSPTMDHPPVPDLLRLQSAIHQNEYLVNGELRRWDGPRQEVLSPVITLEEKFLLGSYPVLGSQEAIEVLAATVQAYDNGKGLWPTLSLAERIGYLETFVLRMAEKKDDVVRLLVWEIGKSYADSVKEFVRTLRYIQDTIDAAKELDRASSRFSVEEGVMAQIRRAPLGVALCMGPFNYPLNETFTTLIPALLMGNTVIFKPPKLGVLLHYPLLSVFKEVFPPGVINTVYGDGAEVIGPLMDSGKIDALAFIGSSRVAGILKSKHPKPYRLRSVLGLEAKNPGIVLPDADLENAVKECVLGSLSFNGQRCTALKILFVHASILDQFTMRFSEVVDDLKCGVPWETDVFITPLAEPGKVDALSEYVDDAVNRGARIVNRRAGRVSASLFFPCVLSPVTSAMRIYHEEQFGPIVPVVPFSELETPLSYVRESPYGQQVSIFGTDTALLAKLIDPLVNQVCRVNLNSQCQRGPDTFPFTGRKDSAEGTLSVSDALRVFSIRTLVAAKESSLNKSLLQKMIRERSSKFIATDFIF